MQPSLHEYSIFAIVYPTVAYNSNLNAGRGLLYLNQQSIKLIQRLYSGAKSKILDDIVYLFNNKLDRWKLRLNQEFTIAFPIAVCEPLNAKP